MNKNIFWIVIILLLVFVGWWFLGQNNDAQAPTGNDQTVGTNEGDDAQAGNTADDVLISYSDSGFTPKETTISQGMTVKFRNNSSRDFWPASALHPSHTVYPGSDIEKCGTEEEGQLFDSCRAVAPSESYLFTFNEVGQWGYHDHLNATFFGKIVVE